MRKLNRKRKKQIAAIAAKKDAGIDLTDMPEVLDWSKAEIGKSHREVSFDSSPRHLLQSVTYGQLF